MNNSIKFCFFRFMTGN
ncbi:peptide IlvX [Citrobacter amalonaticus]|uniref:Uncharacterized protein n=1 Tax=Citrobacter amalonaticus TaxID=35703 RepID=A0A9C7QM89_CITAM|nr:MULTISPECIES: peptide IlvX [Citrobacter]MDU1756968.1 peptide IlvX [Citrobacter sp.]EKW3844343.1 hypothetical protein [Citrobacter amalonaticus]EKW5059171.1 hypothetical protein [Citrobacter amalonaticus]EKW5093879.1 hypothetical protein [Citrobacter amalonaticus]ELB4230041.1 hypothetical protein [Citrobacter amalonaticus]